MDKETWYSELAQIFKAHKCEWLFVGPGKDAFDDYFNDGDSPQEAYEAEIDAAVSSM